VSSSASSFFNSAALIVALFSVLVLAAETQTAFGLQLSLKDDKAPTQPTA
jgi:hypothetical protein